MSESIRVLIVEDEPMLRQSLVQLLQSSGEFNVVASVASGRDAVRMAIGTRPQVVLMDLHLPELSGIEATRQIVDGGVGCAIVVLSHLSDDDSLFSAIRAGAIGYILKDASFEQISDAVRAASKGDGVIYPSLAPRLLNEFRRVAGQPVAQREIYQTLSRREVEVLELLAMGKRNKAIADQLFLSERTVKNHVAAILKKLHANDRTEAAEIAKKHGL